MTIWKVLGLWDRLSTIQRPRDRYQATGTVNIEAGLVNQKWRPNIKTATYVECINDICIDDMRSGWLSSIPDK